MHQIRISLRNLWRNRTFTQLNIAGLAIGMSACWIVFLMLRHEFSYERGLPDKDRIYRVVSHFVFDGRAGGNSGVPIPMTEVLAKEIPNIDVCAPVNGSTVNSVTIPGKGNTAPVVVERPQQFATVDAGYFQMIPRTWLAGNIAEFNGPGKVVLQVDRAQKYFPELQPAQMIGRPIYYNDTIIASVVGIVAPLPYNSDFSEEELLSVGTLRRRIINLEKAWGSCNSQEQLFIKVSPQAHIATIEATINKISTTRSAQAMSEWGNAQRWHTLQPITDRHFNSYFAESTRKADRKVLFSLMGIALFLLLLACINFINLSTAQLPQRSRELGIRKTLGSGSGVLIRQYLTETFLTGVFAAFIGYILTRMFFKTFSDFIPPGIYVHAHIGQTLLFLVLLLVGMSLLSGLYPAWLATKVQPAKILRGEPVVMVGKQRVTLRKGLIVFQFAVAQLFMIVALVMGAQLRYSLNHDLGFQRDAVMTCTIPQKIMMYDTDNNRRFALMQELAKIPGVAKVSLGEAPISNSYSSNTHVFEGEKGKIELNVFRKYADTAYIGLYKMPLLAGTNLPPSDTVNAYLVNETCARALGFQHPEAAVGQYIKESGTTNPVQIVGVVRDFHTATFDNKIEPLALMTDRSSLMEFNILLHKNHADSWQSTIAEMGAIWHQFYPGDEFKPDFLDQNIASMYKSSQQIAQLINLVTVIAILISCLGLFGLATLTSFQRTKEIGVRKVLGASVAHIIGLLSKDFLLLVFLALIIAAPVAWYLMLQYLQQYAYAVVLHWGYVALVGCAAALLAFLTIGSRAFKAALANPVKSLRRD